ncbi:MAG: bis(5'-nucleosyl)-tetraphosphatase (symmetrical) YqeK [Acidaminococcaceae bacterium]|nr:bis(5'-nucleosyl)-tetraphosphatase (symmetrical) YqeK [Acidaminococcaceae bacterium]MDD4722763.1 bis(5'-nucleosyl)-tetraphosphatase (symmetrical) YqeK [Acidaminococcaceae bacterium]
MELVQMKELLKASLPVKRYEHSLAVCETAREFALAHDVDVAKAEISGLLHDCGREVSSRDNLDKAAELGIEVDKIERNQPILLHAKLGVYYAQKKYGITDKTILEGILYHTTGAPHMSKLAKVVYLADLLEPTRSFPGIEEMHELAKMDLEKAMFKAYAQTIRYLLEYDLLIHPSCIAGYNEIAIKYKKKKLAR